MISLICGILKRKKLIYEIGSQTLKTNLYLPKGKSKGER